MGTVERIAVRARPRCDPESRSALISLVSLAVPKESAVDAVFELENELGSACNIISAPNSELRRVPAICDQVAFSLSLVHKIYTAFLKDSISRSRIEDSTGFIVEYCRALFKESDIRVCKALYFSGDKICHEGRIMSGSIDEVIFYPREVMKEALQYNADSITMAFGFPRYLGDSRDRENDDLDRLRHAANTLNITVREPLFITI